MQFKKIEKITIIAILAILMLVTISYASAINTKTNIEKKESPLFQVRTRIVIGEKIIDIFNNIKTKFLGERIFFIPNEWFAFKFIKQSHLKKTELVESCNICQNELHTEATYCVKPITCGNPKVCEV